MLWSCRITSINYSICEKWKCGFRIWEVLRARAHANLERAYIAKLPIFAARARFLILFLLLTCFGCLQLQILAETEPEEKRFCCIIKIMFCE